MDNKLKEQTEVVFSSLRKNNENIVALVKVPNAICFEYQVLIEIWRRKYKASSQQLRLWTTNF
jgi:hypothetical protein